MPLHDLNQVEPRPFADWLREQRAGTLEAELSQHLQELVEAVIQHGKAGELRLTVKVKPVKGQFATVFVSDEVKVTAPEGDRPESVWFVDGRNYALVRNDPRQMQFDDVREPARPTDPPKEA